MTFETVAKVIADNKDMDVAEIKPETTFLELGLDSLDVAEMVMNLEDELGITIELNPALKKVQDIVALVDELQK